MTKTEFRKARMQATKAAAVEYRGTPFVGTEIREMPDGTGGTKLTFTGYASITEAAYKLTDKFGQFEETIARNAFRRTLSTSPDINFLANHEGISLSRTRAGTLKLAEDATGLHVEAKLDPKRPDVQTIRSAIENRELDEMSFSFMVDPGGDHWNDDGTKRRITSVNMDRGADVSVVNFGASAWTGGKVDLRRLGWSDPAKVTSRLLSAGVRPPRLSPVAKPRPQRQTLSYYQAYIRMLRLRGK
jgi:uncharacterized protein